MRSSHMSKLATIGVLTASLLNLFSAHADVIEDAVSLGLTPETLTAAGCEVTDVQEILAALEQSSSELAAIQQAATTCQTLTVELRELRECLALSPRDETVHQQVASKSAALATAQDSLRSLRADLMTDLISPHGQALRDRAAAIRAAPANKLPVTLLVVERTDEEWSCLDAAFRAEQRALRRGADVPGWAAAALATARSDPQVQLADFWMDTRLEDIAELFEQSE